MEPVDPFCPDCDQDMTRRKFGKVVAVAAAATPLLATPLAAAASSLSETAVSRFYGTLKEEQKKVICFPFEHPLRQRINANWRITDPKIESDFYTDEQRKLMDEIYRSVTSEEGYELFQKQLEADSGGFDQYHVAVFGNPGEGKCEWEVTGRHLTLRAGGESGVEFGGPTIYGHGESDPAKNLFHYQTRKANEVFSSLDGAQRKEALLVKAPPENRVALQGTEGVFPGIRVGDLSSDHKKLVNSAIEVILAPYGKDRLAGARATLKTSGGLDELHMAFYRSGDLNEDEMWDIWRLEGPAFVWHFRGAPHVHAYINIGPAARKT
jgi:hypothetical protein